MKKNNPKWIIIHHTGGTDINPLADTSHHTFEIVGKMILAGWHKNLWNFKSRMGYYIGYHYFIDKQGKLKQGRYEEEEGAHCRGMNTSSIGICLAGNFNRLVGQQNHYPTTAQTETLKQLLLDLTKEYSIPIENIVPHRRFSFKNCYGKNLRDNWARNLLKEEKPNIEELKRKISLLQKLILLLQEILRVKIKIQDLLAGIFSQDPYN